MRRKRLNHHADAILGILTGHGMYGQKVHFDIHGLGHYKYDYRSDILLFNDTQIATLPIFKWIHNWFNNEVSNHDTSDGILTKTFVHVYLTGLVDRNAGAKYRWWIFKFPYRKAMAYKALFDVEIQSNDDDYSKQAVGVID